MNMSAPEVAEVPPGVVTVTSTGPALCGGAVAMQLVDEHATALAAAEPKATEVRPPDRNPVPVIVTLVPPATDPDVGSTPVTVGAGAAA